MTMHSQIKTVSPAAIRSGKEYPFSPKIAWKLWEHINVLSDLLWEAYGHEFLDYRVEECEKISAKEPDT